MSMSRKIVLIIGGVIVALAMLGLIVWLVVDITLPPRFEIKDERLIIHDSYSAEINLTNAEIVMSEEGFKITKKVFGAATQKMLKGKFTITGVEQEVYLSLMNPRSAYILIKSGEERFYINMKTSEQTLDLYNRLINR